jgi:hypothetical protein
MKIGGYSENLVEIFTAVTYQRAATRNTGRALCETPRWDVAIVGVDFVSSRMYLHSQFSRLFCLSQSFGTQRNTTTKRALNLELPQASNYEHPRLVSSYVKTCGSHDRWRHALAERVGGMCELCDAEGESPSGAFEA